MFYSVFRCLKLEIRGMTPPYPTFFPLTFKTLHVLVTWCNVGLPAVRNEFSWHRLIDMCPFRLLGSDARNVNSSSSFLMIISECFLISSCQHNTALYKVGIKFSLGKGSTQWNRFNTIKLWQVTVLCSSLWYTLFRQQWHDRGEEASSELRPNIGGRFKVAVMCANSWKVLTWLGGVTRFGGFLRNCALLLPLSARSTV